jgi:3'(2'), 5'-bisphosphate nucleotidase
MQLVCVIIMPFTELGNRAGGLPKHIMQSLDTDRFQKEADFAIRAVSEAAHLVNTIQKESDLSPLAKQDRSPVTVADFASQALVAQRLLQEFPEDPLVAEEDAQELRGEQHAEVLIPVTDFVRRYESEATPELVCDWVDHGGGIPSGRFWTLDPIDGTKGFLRGEQYVVALALIENGEVVLGALGCPHLSVKLVPERAEEGSIVLAVRQKGTWSGALDGAELERVQVSQIAAPEQAQLLLSVESGHTNLGKIDEVRAALGNSQDPIRMDSQAKLAVLAGGSAELIFRLLSPAKPHYREKIWDQAAGSLIVEEAGGRITDLQGLPLDFTAGRELMRNTGVVASNGLLHQAALDALTAVGLHEPIPPQ